MLTPSTLIHGTGYWDTLEVIKKRNSSYKLLVNRAVIDSLPAARVDFLITGAGIFVDQGMSVWADYFHVGSDVSTAVAHHPSKNVLGYTYRIYAPSVNDYLVDPLGRVITIRTTHGTIYRPALAPGYYLAPDHKKWTVVKKR